MKLNIQIYPATCQQENGFPFCYGKISIGDYLPETIQNSVTSWNHYV